MKTFQAVRSHAMFRECIQCKSGATSDGAFSMMTRSYNYNGNSVLNFLMKAYQLNVTMMRYMHSKWCVPKMHSYGAFLWLMLRFNGAFPWCVSIWCVSMVCLYSVFRRSDDTFQRCLLMARARIVVLIVSLACYTTV